MNRIIIGLVQMQSGTDKEENLSTAERLINEAAGRGAKLVALPEYFSFGALGPIQREIAESVPGPTVDRLRIMARAAHVYLVGGSLAECVRGSDKLFNTAVLISPDGEIIATYRKIHLFHLEMENQPAVRESDFLAPGDTVTVAETEYGALGLTICYDLRFPEIYRALVLQGAKIIFVVSSFMAVTGRDHWEPLLRARAIENQVFMAAPNQAGTVPGTDIVRYGHSLVVDPWGNVVSHASNTEEVITAVIDMDQVAKVREQLPSLRDRRPDVYRRISWF